MKLENIPVQIPENYLNFAGKHLDRRKKHTEGTLNMIKKLLTDYPRLEKLEESMYQAALFHDCARELSADRQLSLAQKFWGSLDEIERNVSSLWHGPAGAQLLIENLGFSREDKIIRAVAYHSTGLKNPPPVVQALVVADFTEVSRKFSEAQKLRNKMGRWSFNKLVQTVFKNKIIFCLEKNSKLHPRSIEAYNSLCD